MELDNELMMLSTPTPQPAQSTQIDVWRMSLKELSENEQRLIALCNDENSPLDPDDAWGLVKACRELIAGKIDNIALLCKNIIPAHRSAVKEAAAKQIARLDRLEEKLKSLIIESLVINHASRMDGTFWSARVQNSTSVDIHDSSSVPKEYYEAKITITTKFKAADIAKMDYWQKLMDQFKDDPTVKAEMTFDIPKMELRAALKDHTIPGARIVKNPHVRFEAGKISPEPIPDMPFLME